MIFDLFFALGPRREKTAEIGGDQQIGRIPRNAVRLIERLQNVKRILAQIAEQQIAPEKIFAQQRQSAGAELFIFVVLTLLRAGILPHGDFAAVERTEQRHEDRIESLPEPMDEGPFPFIDRKIFIVRIH